jgi:hypothetical protein
MMPAHPSTPPHRERVLAVFDDTHDAARVIEWSAALALALNREFGVVYVQSTDAWVAASLPFTQVLAPAGAAWAAFAPPDMERAYRAQAERLRGLAERAAQRRDLNWSLQTLRGALSQLVFDAFAQVELLFVAPTALPVAAPPRARRASRRLQVAVAFRSGDQGAELVALAQALAAALGAELHVIHIGQAGDATLPRSAANADLLVLPRPLTTPAILARLSCPALMVAQEVAQDVEQDARPSTRQ